MHRSTIHFTSETPTFGGSVQVSETAQEVETRLRIAARNADPSIFVTRCNRSLLLPVSLIGPVAENR